MNVPLLCSGIYIKSLLRLIPLIGNYYTYKCLSKQTEMIPRNNKIPLIDNIFIFRRMSYGNVTHLNISVTVNEDNRAILGVALDQSDSVYFGCDAGCLDAPVPLSQSYTKFPVKLTNPMTAILYITSNYQHMQELQSALHVHTVDEGE